ncbi:hypothetical protein GF352_03820 [archaeon]|nr:hypothetical protein [archaeon]
MKQLLVMGLILLLTGCTQASDDLPMSNDSFDMSVVISECESLCNVDADAYCEEIRTIEVNDVEINGTCRAFSRKGNVPGFDKCERFCREYDKSGTVCEVGGVVDDDCDGEP